MEEVHCVSDKTKTFESEAFGRLLANPLPSEEVVISGISGRFPCANDIDEFRYKLYNKVDMIVPNKRWDIDHPEIPKKTGIIPNCEKYDCGFFGTHARQGHSMDPMQRMALEKAIECIIDAGLNPSDLENTRTGVFVGVCFSESEHIWVFLNIWPQNFCFIGCARSIIAHRISYFLKLKGPSFIIDTACSSSLYAIEHAYKAIRTGECENAIVIGSNLCLHPMVSLQFARLGVLSADAACKSFDKRADGYARSEAICAVFLQKSKDAKRLYTQIVHAKTNCDGYKEQSITYPNGLTQKMLLEEFYKECSIDPGSLSFLEAHGTGTVVGDPEECAAIDQVFTATRQTPLLIGSVKSNIGHSEPSSGLCSVTKCIIGMEDGYIPPNIHYTEAKDDILSIKQGRLKVVSEKMKLENKKCLIGVNSFGFGGANCHVLLRQHDKEKINGGKPNDNLPRLVCVSGRTAEAIITLLDDVCDKFDAEHIGLLHEVFRKDIANHVYRGYTIVSKTGEIYRSMSSLEYERPSLYLVFGKLNNWYNIAKHLYAISAFSESIQRIQNILLGKSINIIKIILNPEAESKGVYSILGSIAVQICIADILKVLDIKPKATIGYSFGELICAYYDEVLTLEEVINCAYIINDEFYPTRYILNNTEQVNGHSKSGVKNKLYEQAYEEQNTEKEFKERILQIKEQLLNKLQKILYPPRRWQQKYASAEYFIQALEESVSEKYFKSVESRSILLGMSSAAVETIIADKFDNIQILSFNTCGNQNHCNNLLKILGSIYEFGYNPLIKKLYPDVKFPVSRGTPMISPKIKWNDSREWYVVRFEPQDSCGGEKIFKLNLQNTEWTFISGHVIDGRNLFPAAGYLFLVWKMFCTMKNTDMVVQEVTFTNCKFLRATTMSETEYLELVINIHSESGNFEITEKYSPVVTGTISISNHFNDDKISLENNDTRNSTALSIQSRDIYKELRLRGYNYSGEFKAIKEYDPSISKGLIKWTCNWITFIDNMFQLKILGTDSRLLYVPTSVAQITISPPNHLKCATGCINYEEVTYMPAFLNQKSDIISCGGIEVRGLIATSITRKKYLGTPVLESYTFVPNNTKLSTHQSVRVTMQIILENSLVFNVSTVEVIDEEVTPDFIFLSPIIQSVLEDQPLIQADIKILSNSPLNVSVPVEDKTLEHETNCSVVIATNVFKRPQVLFEAFRAIKEDGYVISRESIDFDVSSVNRSDIEIVTVHRTVTETFLLLRRSSKYTTSSYINIKESDKFKWLPAVQSTLKNNNEVVLYNDNEPVGGILGLVNCLRREPGGKNIKCIFVMDQTSDQAKQFNLNNNFYVNQLKKNMAVNIYKNGEWGTYRHLLLEDSQEVESEHCFVNLTVRGDLSTLKWMEGPLRSDDKITDPKYQLVQIYYAAINFRDIMTATGKINADVITMSRLEQECVQGIEFSGKDASGTRVMGMVPYGALATMVLADSSMLWKIPDSWSLEEAVTVPVVYSTVIYALKMRGEMKQGDSILIHSGTGGVGQAAIRFALFHGCKVFTTVGTTAKREFLKKTYPQLTDKNIGNSHDLSFEQMIMKETNGRGVDIVLNSLAEEKLIASIRCLARGGRFLEIGKFDISSNNSLRLLLLQKDISFHGVMLDKLFVSESSVKNVIGQFIQDGIDCGAIQPLDRNVFQYNEIEQAFRFMAGGKHMGKVIIEIRKEEEDSGLAQPIRKFKGTPRYFCKCDKSYVIIGGLGGFGLELADWLIRRGARKIILVSRSGIKTGYQEHRVKLWKSYGATVNISTADVTSKEGCRQLIKEAQRLGQVEGVFNLAVILQDSIFENQTIENFEISFAPKACATKYLDEVTREICPNLRDFVVFSSVSCGRGNAGQTNYGMANSVMERICEKRREDGYPALAIEWGAIGEVGLVADMQENNTELAIGGTLQQRVSSCLQAMDILLSQKNVAIVSSMVVAEKKSSSSGFNNVVDAVANILGIDLKTISYHSSSLGELGMDSMTAVEIKQTLDREFDVCFTPKEIRSMTFARLQELQEERDAEDTMSTTEGDESPNILVNLDMIFRFIIDESESKNLELRMSTMNEDLEAPNVLLFPGIEGFSKTLDPLVRHLNAQAICFQYDYSNPQDTITDMAKAHLTHVEKYLTKTEPFCIVAHSYGVIVALEVISILESRGHIGKIFCVDGSHTQLKELLKIFVTGSEEELQTNILCHMMTFYVTNEVILTAKGRISQCNSLEERINALIEIGGNKIPHSKLYQKQLCVGLFKRIFALHRYKPNFSTIKSTVILCKPTQHSVPMISEDYDLSELCGKPVEVCSFEGNHLTILSNEHLAKKINSCIINK